MRILLDHCVDRGLARFFPIHEVQTAGARGWERLRNGELLARAALDFDVLVTVDHNLRFQQNISKLPIPVLQINASDTRLKTLKLLSAFFEPALEQTHSNRFVVLHADGRIEVIAPA